MKFQLSDFFAGTAAIVLWVLASRTAIPLATAIAGIFSLLAVTRVPAITLIAFVGSLESLLHFPTCACMHLSSSTALWATSTFFLLGWCGVLASAHGGLRSSAIPAAVAFTATSVLLKNAQDILYLGHHPLWPDSWYARSTLPQSVETLMLMSMFVSASLSLILSYDRWMYSPQSDKS